MLDKMTVHALHSLFLYFDSKQNVVTWMRSLDYQHQLYVSSSFEIIWGTSSQVLYENPDTWNKYLVKDKDYVQLMKILKNRTSTHFSQPQAPLLYKITATNGVLCYLRDYAFLITDNYQNKVAIAGFSEVLSKEEWVHEFYRSNSSPDQDQVRKDKLFNALMLVPLENNSAFTLQDPYPKSQSDIRLTTREKQCVHYLLLGKTIKETAKILVISPRTATEYIENVKSKFNCRTKFELVRKILEADPTVISS